MPNRVEKFPGSWVSTLPWDEMSDGEAWEVTVAEMKEAGVKVETVRVYAHAYAKEHGFKFRTKMVEGSLYLQAHTPREALKKA